MNETQQILSRFIQYKSLRERWRRNVSEDLNFCTPGGQWTEKQVQDLAARNQAALEIPIISPQIELQKAQILGKPPQFRTIGRTDDDVERAKGFSELMEYIWYQNQADIEVDSVVDNQLEASKGYFHIYFDPNGDDGYGLITIKSLHPLEVVPDPESRDRFEEDSVYKYIYRMIDIDKAKLMFPQYIEDIDHIITSDEEILFNRGNQASEENIPILDEIRDVGRKTILYLEQQRKINVNYWVVEYNDGQREIVREFTENQFEAFRDNLEKDIDRDVILQAIKSAKQIIKKRIERKLILGNKEIFTEILPTSHYTIIPIPYKHRGNPYTYSLTRKLKGLQQEVNFRRSLMIAHATASTNFRVLAHEQAFDDFEAAEENLARPNAIQKVHFDPSLPNGGIVMGQPIALPSALYALEERAKYDAQYAAGSFGPSHGDPRQIPDTYRATLMLDENAMRRTGLVAKNLYYGLNIVGRIVLDFIQHYMKTSRIIRIINPYDINDQQVKKIAIGDVYDDETIINLGDPSVGRYDVQVIVGSMTPANRYLELDIYREFKRDGIIDDIEVLKKTDIFDREGVIERNSQMARLTQALSQLSEENKKLQGDNESLKDKLVTAKIALKTSEAMKVIEKHLENGYDKNNNQKERYNIDGEGNKDFQPEREIKEGGV